MMNLFNKNLGGNKQAIPNLQNIQNNVSSPNKNSKVNNKIINPMINFPLNTVNLNN